MASSKVVIASRVYLPKSWVDTSVLKSEFERKHYAEYMCKKCPLLKDRHTPTCDTCVNYLGVIRLYSETKRDGREYVGLPPGDMPRLESLLDLDLSGAIDKRKIHYARHGLRFTGRLRRGGIDPDTGASLSNQVDLLRQWEKSNYESGFVVASPRSGKTVCAVYAMTELMPYRTIITAAQGDWLGQFEKRFYENTNLARLEKEGRRPIMRLEGSKDFALIDKWDPDIVLLAYQQCISSVGVERVWDFLRGRFSAVHVDEADMAAALMFSSFISRLDCRIKVGWTATPDRKDGLDSVVKWIIGPVRAETYTVGLKPNIKLLETGIGKGKSYKNWSAMEAALLNSEKREKLLIKHIFDYLEMSPDHYVLMPIKQTAPIQRMVSQINHEAEVRRRKGQRGWPQETAVKWDGKTKNREELLSRIARGDYRVVVAQNKMIQRGLDVPPWTRVYVNMTPESNPYIAYQKMARVSTPKVDKPTPEVILIIDYVMNSIWCARILWQKEISPHLAGAKNMPEGHVARYMVDGATRQRLLEVCKHPKSYSPPTEEKKEAGRGRSFTNVR